MTTLEFLSELRNNGVRLASNGDRLRLSAPKDVLTQDLRAELTARKAEIIAFLRATEVSAPPEPPPLESVNRTGRLPLSFAQQRLWFLDQLTPASPAYIIDHAVKITGPLQPNLLARGLNEVVQRHETLRTTFGTADGEPFQIVAPEMRLDLPVVDLSSLSREERECEVQKRTAAMADNPFDLYHGPLIRADLLRLTATEHILLLAMHHIIADGWSIGVIIRELLALYEAFAGGKPSPLPALPIQYADYAEWQRRWLQGEVLEKQLSYWRGQLAEAAALELPTDHPRPVSPGFHGGRESITLDRELTDTLKALSRREGVTLFMTLLAAFKVLMYRYTGQTDLSVGSPIAGRNRTESEGLIGFFLNTLVLRTDLSGDPLFTELLRRVGETALAAYAHQDVPFELLLQTLRPERNLSATPLFQVMFNMLNFADTRLDIPGLTMEILSAPDHWAKFDLTLYITERAETLQLAMVYNTELFARETIVAMLERFQTLIASITAHPDRRLSALSLLTEAARRQTAARDNRVFPVNPFLVFGEEETDQSLPDRFAKQVRAHGDKLAVQTDRHQWTYAELDQRTNRIAAAILAARGEGEERILLLFDHDAPMIAGILGVLKAGKTYVPLDPQYPPERLAYIRDDARSGAVLTDNANLKAAETLAGEGLQLFNLDALPAPTEASTPAVPPDTVAYILYTSGSTGRPKGVMQSHHHVLGHIKNYTNHLHLAAADRLTLFSSYCFDAAVMDIFGALMNGATLYPMDIRTRGFAHLAGWLAEHSLTIYHSTPTVYRYFINALSEEEIFPNIRLVVMGGEEVVRRDAESFRKHFPAGIMVNGLGPTESTLALQFFLDRTTSIVGHTIPVGYPVGDTEILLLDEARKDMEIRGEIAVRGPNVALGYWQQPELTAGAFLPDPDGGKRRIYCTGDLGRRLADGAIEFLGRKDTQVKIKGFRIELGEIEAALGRHPAVREAVVVAREDGGRDHPSPSAAPGADKRLVVYLVPQTDEALDILALRGSLRESLPEYMVPSAFVTIPAIPLTPSGKVDRLALPTPAQDGIMPPETYAPPRNRTEEALAQIWGEVLGRGQVGVHENFFDLGGDSILSLQIVDKANKAGVGISLRQLFLHQTIAALAAAAETDPAAMPAPSGASVAPAEANNQAAAEEREAPPSARPLVNPVTTPAPQRVREEIHAFALPVNLARDLDPALDQALLGCFFTDDARFEYWYYGSYLHIASSTMGMLRLTYEDLKTDELFEHKSLTYRHLLALDPIADLIVEKLHAGFYPLVYLDEFYCRDRAGYHKTHRPTWLAIFGYSGREFSAFGLDEGSDRYRRVAVSFEVITDLVAQTQAYYGATASLAEKCALELFRVRESAPQPTGVAAFQKGLADYLFPRATCYTSLRYGLDVYADVTARLEGLCRGEKGIDEEALVFLVHHKKAVCDRLAYFLPKNTDLRQEYQTVLDQCQKLRAELSGQTAVTPVVLRQALEAVNTAAAKEKDVLGKALALLQSKAGRGRRKILRIELQKKLTTWVTESMPLCIILANDKLLPWFYQHYIQVFSQIDKFGVLRLDYLETQGHLRDVLFDIMLTYEMMPQNLDIIDYITDRIDDGYYPRVAGDEFYLPGRIRHQKKHFIFSTLIHGYDHDEELLYGIGFGENRSFSKQTITYADFRAAYAGGKFHTPADERKDFWYGKKPLRLYLPRDYDVAYPFSAKKFLDELHDYTYGAGDPSRLMHTVYCQMEKGLERVRYGMDIYGEVKRLLPSLLRGAAAIDYRGFHLLQEHKKLLHERLRYVVARYNLQKDIAALVSNYQGIVNSFEDIRKMHFKEVFTGFTAANVERITARFDRAVIAERALLIDLCDRLRQALAEVR